jgi:hypothetical protein
VRGNGGANIVSTNTPTQILLRNPFNLQGVQPKPNPARLTMDIVVAPRIGRRRLTGAVSVTVAPGSAAAPTDPFFGLPAATIMGTLPIANQGVAEQPLFGISKTIAPPAKPPSTFLELVVSLMTEASPRQAGLAGTGRFREDSESLARSARQRQQRRGSPTRSWRSGGVGWSRFVYDACRNVARIRVVMTCPRYCAKASPGVKFS